MKKVCVVTAARSEYGLLRWLLRELQSSSSLQLQLLVTGSHLSSEYGFTYREIKDDGFQIDKKVEFLLSSSTATGIAKSMGLCSISISDTLSDLSPDLMVVLGDRYELLPICSAALVMRIPIAHISGGDITEGAIDDQIRNAVTMMSHLHFPGTESSAERIIRMIGSTENVFCVGEPGLDNFLRLELMDRKVLAENLGLDINKKWYLVTLHPETKESLSYNLSLARNLMETLKDDSGMQAVITQSNADLGGVELNNYFHEVAMSFPSKFQLYPSLGQLRYLSFMKEAACIIGNSSSGIVEAPFLGKPVLNLGERQLGRHLCHNVLSVSGFDNSIKEGLSKLEGQIYSPDYYYGDGLSSQRISKYIHDYLL